MGVGSCGGATCSTAAGATALAVTGALGRVAGVAEFEPILLSVGAGAGAGAGAADTPRSNFVRRSARAATSLSRSGRVKRTMATSSMAILSGALFISRILRPTVSRIRTVLASPSCCPQALRRVASSLTALATSAATRSKNTWRTWAAKDSASCSGSQPSCCNLARARIASPASLATRELKSSSKTGSLADDSPVATSWSRALSASRAEPFPKRTAAAMVPSSTPRPAAFCTSSSKSLSVSPFRSRNSKCCVRLRMVGMTLCGSVVARTKTTRDGGSSSVFNKAAEADFESWWTSSRMYTFQCPGDVCHALAVRSRMASTPLFEAESNSRTSSDRPWVIATQLAHSLHASPSLGFSQLSALARMRAVVVLPVPRGPEKR